MNYKIKIWGWKNHFGVKKNNLFWVKQSLFGV